MLDYIYRPSLATLDGLALIIHKATTSLPNAKSIVWRRDLLASLIAKYMDQCSVARVMSIACGHMRELDTLRVLTQKANVSFVALDQDKDSIEEAIKSYKEYSITGYTSSFTGLIKGSYKDERYDLIYSAGLFDYLPDIAATALIKAMVLHLTPGGMVSIGNFTRDSHGRGFMAGFMDWCLVYRDESDLVNLVATACPGLSYRTFRDEPGNVAYVEITRTD